MGWSSKSWLRTDGRAGSETRDAQERGRSRWSSNSNESLVTIVLELLESEYRREDVQEAGERSSAGDLRSQVEQTSNVVVTFGEDVVTWVDLSLIEARQVSCLTLTLPSPPLPHSSHPPSPYSPPPSPPQPYC